MKDECKVEPYIDLKGPLMQGSLIFCPFLFILFMYNIYVDVKTMDFFGGTIMLYDLISAGYGEEADLNCAEKILWGANEAYNLGLDKNALKIASGFGGGMGVEGICGALTGAIMVLGVLFVDEKAHESTKIKELSKEFLGRYEETMGSIDCAPLKKNYRTGEEKCENIILKSAELLDYIVARELEYRH